jgi:hypothetical protein
MTAASSYTQNSAVTAKRGVSVSAGLAPLNLGASATTVGNPVSYTAAGVSAVPPPTSLVPPGATPADFMTTFVDQFAAAQAARSFIGLSLAGLDPNSADDPLIQYKKNKDDIVVEGQTCKR